MIESVKIFKKNTTVIIRYKSGKRKTTEEIPNTAINFILRKDVKAFENDYSILYRIDKNLIERR